MDVKCMTQLSNKCLKCDVAVSGGLLWEISNRMGLLCDLCEAKTRYQQMASVDEMLIPLGMPSCLTMIQRQSMGYRTFKAKAIDPSAKTVFFVRCCPLGVAPSFTVGILPDEHSANVFAAFWQRFISTEVGVTEVDSATDPNAESVNDLERLHYRMKLDLQRRHNHQPLRPPPRNPYRPQPGRVPLRYPHPRA
jgi:hypothetical protein